ncbi:phosphopantetheine-binding protein [Pseudomonas sp. MWU13-2105]|uniref:phosphopantetheine-binding protein n=1 Tax=Pseudomonas sp. MWU13-2105 TaxID=2935074 RepID=UPI00200E4962|nr:phosphopantetheine-binding protein [Pseudomonas sp. MWU13-2105]
MFDVICQTIRSLSLQGILPAHLNSMPLQPDDALLDLGLDSLSQLTLLSELRGRLEVSIPSEPIDGMTTLRELAQLLEGANVFDLSPAI